MVDVRYSGGPTNKFGIASLGGQMSSESIPNAQLDNLFDDVNRIEVINNRIEHRCFFIINDGATDYLKARAISIAIPEDTEISFAVDKSTTPQLLVSEDATPVGLTFFKFSEWNTLEVPIGTLDVGDSIAVWIKRKVLAGSDSTRTIFLHLDGIDNAITLTGDFGSIQNSFDNDFVNPRSALFYTDQDYVGEALLN